jgi:uncharacterized protein involved in exopolysaccharide biosynthesis
MSIHSQRQLENTQRKLQMLEDRLRVLQTEPAANLQTRQLTKRSLTKLINQMKEEITRFTAHVSSHSAD